MHLPRSKVFEIYERNIKWPKGGRKGHDVIVIGSEDTLQSEMNVCCAGCHADSAAAEKVGYTS